MASGSRRRTAAIEATSSGNDVASASNAVPTERLTHPAGRGDLLTGVGRGAGAASRMIAAAISESQNRGSQRAPFRLRPSGRNGKPTCPESSNRRAASWCSTGKHGMRTFDTIRSLASRSIIRTVDLPWLCTVDSGGLLMVCVVGVDGSDGSRVALRWGYDFTEAMGDRLCVVRAWEYPSMSIMPGRAGLRGPDEVDAVVAAEVAEFVREVLGADAEHAEVMAERGAGRLRVVACSTHCGPPRSWRASEASAPLPVACWVRSAGASPSTRRAR